jgi:hypothetical protein
LQWDVPHPGNKIQYFNVYKYNGNNPVFESRVYPPFISCLVLSAGLYTVAGVNEILVEGEKSVPISVWFPLATPTLPKAIN